MTERMVYLMFVALFGITAALYAIKAEELQLDNARLQEIAEMPCQCEQVCEALLEHMGC